MANTTWNHRNLHDNLMDSCRLGFKWNVPLRGMNVLFSEILDRVGLIKVPAKEGAHIRTLQMFIDSGFPWN